MPSSLESLGGNAGQIVRDALTVGQAFPTYGTTIAVNSNFGVQKITVTDGVAFTINNPTGLQQVGSRITFDILNSAGGAHGTITWDTLYKLAGALAAIANTKRKTITFYWDGTNWVEVGRAAADI
jgi:hypothetical protein